jgi:hypothetical protein
MKKFFAIIILVTFSEIASAKIGLNVSLIFKKGIGKGFFLSTEQHSIEQIDEHEYITVQMKNGIKAELTAFYVQSVHEFGPSGFVRIKGSMYNQKGKRVKTLNEPVIDIYLGESKAIVHEESGEEQIELIIKPVSF